MDFCSIFDEFVINSDQKLELLLKEKDNKDKRKIPKIDINERIKRGKEVLENF